VAQVEKEALCGDQRAEQYDQTDRIHNFFL
jgi:hypothetical protein